MTEPELRRSTRKRRAPERYEPIEQVEDDYSDSYASDEDSENSSKESLSASEYEADDDEECEESSEESLSASDYDADDDEDTISKNCSDSGERSSAGDQQQK